MNYTEGSLRSKRVSKFHMQIYAFYWPEGGAACQNGVFIGQYMQLIGSYWPEQVA